MDHITNEAVARVLAGSRYWEDLYEAVSATETVHHSDETVDQEIETLWVEAETALGDDKDIVAGNLEKIWNLLKTG